MTAKLTKIFSLNDIAKAIERDKTTIIKWEKLGKIPSAKRDERGWRYYTEQEADKIIQIAEKIKSQRPKRRKKRSRKYSAIDLDKILKRMPAEKVLKHILNTPKMRQKLIARIVKDNKLHKQITKLLINNMTKKRKL